MWRRRTTDDSGDALAAASLNDLVLRKQTALAERKKRAEEDVARGEQEFIKWLALDMRAKIVKWLRKHTGDHRLIYRLPRINREFRRIYCVDTAIDEAVKPFNDTKTRITGTSSFCVYHWYKYGGDLAVIFVMNAK